MSVIGLDHVAIPTANPDAMLSFYRALGFEVPEPGEWRTSGIPFFSIQFGNNKINVHAPDLWQDSEFELRGPTARPGCGDFCFVWSGTLEELKEALRQAGAEIVEGSCGASWRSRRGSSQRYEHLYTRSRPQFAGVHCLRLAA